MVIRDIGIHVSGIRDFDIRVNKIWYFNIWDFDIRDFAIRRIKFGILDYNP